MVATLSDSEDINSNKEERNTANLCLITLEDEVSVEYNLEFTFDELRTTFYELLAEFKKADLKNKTFKQTNDVLQKKKKDEDLQKKFCKKS